MDFGIIKKNVKIGVLQQNCSYAQGLTDWLNYSNYSVLYKTLSKRLSEKHNSDIE